MPTEAPCKWRSVAMDAAPSVVIREASIGPGSGRPPRGGRVRALAGRSPPVRSLRCVASCRVITRTWSAAPHLRAGTEAAAEDRRQGSGQRFAFGRVPRDADGGRALQKPPVGAARRKREEACQAPTREARARRTVGTAPERPGRPREERRRARRPSSSSDMRSSNRTHRAGREQRRLPGGRLPFGRGAATLPRTARRASRDTKGPPDGRRQRGEPNLSAVGEPSGGPSPTGRARRSRRRRGAPSRRRRMPSARP